MPRKAPLRVVSPDEAQTRKPMTVREAAGGSTRDALVALRDKIAAEIDKGVPPHALAPLSRQLRDLIKEIEAIDAEDSEDDVGEAARTPDEEWTAN